MTRKFNYNFTENTIVGSKRSIERANKGLEPEFSELTKMLKEQPTFKLEVKKINNKENKKTHKGLDFKRMEKFISLLDNREELMKEYETVREFADAKGSAYPTTKKWFLNKFPEFKAPKTEEEQREFDKLFDERIITIAKRVNADIEKAA